MGPVPRRTHQHRPAQERRSTMSRMTFITALACLTIGGAGGWLLHGDSPTTQPVPVAGPSLSPPASIASATNSYGSIDFAQLRAVIREELAVQSAKSGASTVQVVTQPATPDLVAKRRAAVEEIGNMVRGGEWGNEQ